MKAIRDARLIKRVPREACLWLLITRLWTGGLKPLALVGKISALIAERDIPLTGQRRGGLGSRKYSGCTIECVGDGDVRKFEFTGGK